MVITNKSQITNMCPVCGCYFKSRMVLSYNTIGAIRYSDGFKEGYMMPAIKYAVKCPKCNTFVLVKDLIRVKEALPQSKMSSNNKNEIVGDLDRDYVSILDYATWEKIIATGQYISNDAGAQEILNIKENIYQILWRSYNRNRDKIDDAKYQNVCKILLDLIEPTNDEKLLTKAELLRNLGMYQKSLDTLNMIKEKELYHIYISTISDACKNKISKTLICEW